MVTNIAAAQVTFPNNFYAYRMNNNGVVCGNIHNPAIGLQDTPVIFDNSGNQTILPLLPGTTKGTAVDVNDEGNVIGILQNQAGQRTGVLWTINHIDGSFIVTTATSASNEFPTAINNNGIIAFGSQVFDIASDNCTVGQAPNPNNHPCYTCNGVIYIIPNAPMPTANGMIAVGKSADNRSFAVQQLYSGAWRADITSPNQATWTFLDQGGASGVSLAATLDHYDVFGYKGHVGDRVGTIWHPHVLLPDGHQHYGETVFLSGTQNILDSSSGNSYAGIPPLRLVQLTNGHFQTRKVTKALDLNCDGLVNNFDIDYFIGSMGYPNQKMFPEFPDPCQYTDIDSDGAVTFFDADLFIEELLME